jgi:hypothetical protein
MTNKETIEEFAKQEAIKQYSEDTFGNLIVRKSIEKGANFQQEQDKNKYSEEEVLDILFTMSVVNPTNITEWFRQFKKIRK